MSRDDGSEAGTPLGHCPACLSRARKLAGAKGELVLWRCEACSLVYTDPQPRRLVEHRYLADYDLDAHFSAVAGRKDVLFVRRLAHLPRPIGPDPRLCDVGCANGQFLSLASSQGWSCLGVELNPPAVRQARARGFTVHEGPLERISDLPWGSFDVVTCWDVIEHTPEPRRFAERLLALLKPSGMLFVTTLNVNSLVARVFGMRWSMVADDHFTYWAPSALTSLLEEGGARIVDCRTSGVGRDFVGWIDRRIAAAHSTSRAAGCLDRGAWDVKPIVLRAESIASRVLGFAGAGVELFVVGRAG